MSDSGITGDLAELEQLERRLERASASAIAKLGAKKLGRVAKGQYRAGAGPDGAPWERNKDGSKPLPNAAADVTFSAEGSAIVGRAPFHYRFHRAKRPVFPGDDGPLPQPWEQALIEAGREIVEGKN